MDIKNKQIVILGLGGSGEAAAQLALQQGGKVFVFDEGCSEAVLARARKLMDLGATVECGCQTAPQIKADLVVISPGVLPQGILGRYAADCGAEVLSELEFGWSFMSDLPLIAITGTNGKTTTTELCSMILNGNGLTTCSSGNIGYPVSSLVEQAGQMSLNVFEVSSFQLEHIHSFHPKVGILTNITPDHLERYDSFEDYARAKLNLFSQQTAEDWAVVQWDALQIIRKHIPGFAFPSKLVTYSAESLEADIILQDGRIVCGGTNGLESGDWLEVKRLKLLGNHNVENVMAAVAAAHVMGVPLPGAVCCASAFLPSGHRCELVGELDGVRYIDDSKATNVDAVRQALKMMPSGQKTWLIAGGKDKGFEFDGLEDLLSTRVHEAILIGETRRKICEQWQKYVLCSYADSLEGAVRYAASSAAKEEVVLLSPACSSFDMFKSYAHRGDVFKKTVAQLIDERTLKK